MNNLKVERFEDVIKLVGNTPLVRLKTPSGARVLIKLEYTNPTGSHKDRIAAYMLKAALKSNVFKKSNVVVGASSGNTGIAVTTFSKVLGLKPVIVVRETTVAEVKATLKSLGAELVEVPGDENIRDKARKLAEDNGWVFLNQFENVENIRAHYETTGPELWVQSRGEIDVFVMGIGTAGTIVGVGSFLKKMNSNVKVYGVVPKGSPVVGGPGGLEYIPGLAGHTDAPLLDRNLLDDIFEVDLKSAIEAALWTARSYGLPVGLSTGASLHVAMMLADKLGGNVRIATIAADSIHKYSSLIREWLPRISTSLP